MGHEDGRLSIEMVTRFQTRLIQGGCELKVFFNNIALLWELCIVTFQANSTSLLTYFVCVPDVVRNSGCLQCTTKKNDAEVVI